MKKLIVVALVASGCSTAGPVQGPAESPNTPLHVLENSGTGALEVEDHYDDVNRITDEMFGDR